MRYFLVERAIKWHHSKGFVADARTSRISDRWPGSTLRCNDDCTSVVHPPGKPILLCSGSSYICTLASANRTSYLGFSLERFPFCHYVKARSFCDESGEFRHPEKNGRIVKTSGSKDYAIPMRQRLGPSVRRLLIESGIDIATLQGTGPGGCVVKGDVIAAMKSENKPKEVLDLSKLHKASRPKTSKAPFEALTQPSSMLHDDLPTSQIQKEIARRLSESKEGTPHLYLSADTLLDATLFLRQELRVNYNLHISLNDFFIKAVASALKQVPNANAHWDEKLGVVSGSSVDISIAVAAEKGLMTPILRNADQKSLLDINIEMKSLAGKAREGKLQPHDFQGGSFSISNLGMFEVDHFRAVINPPQACILAIGRGESAVVWQEDLLYPSQGKPKAVTKANLTLSADHRVVDVDIGGQFLDALGDILRDPRAYLL